MDLRQGIREVKVWLTLLASLNQQSNDYPSILWEMISSKENEPAPLMINGIARPTARMWYSYP